MCFVGPKNKKGQDICENKVSVWYAWKQWEVDFVEVRISSNTRKRFFIRQAIGKGLEESERLGKYG